VLKVMDSLESEPAGTIDFALRTLDAGQVVAVPIIHELIGKHLAEADDRAVVFDAQNETSCPLVETMRGADSFGPSLR
jgi:hypothetical protein